MINGSNSFFIGISLNHPMRPKVAAIVSHAVLPAAILFGLGSGRRGDLVMAPSPSRTLSSVGYLLDCSVRILLANIVHIAKRRQTSRTGAGNAASKLRTGGSQQTSELTPGHRSS